MSDKTFEVVIDEHYCKGCALCIEFCPAGKLYIQEKPTKLGVQPAAAKPDVNCTGCSQCAIICPDAAIRLCRVEFVCDTAPDDSRQASDE